MFTTPHCTDRAAYRDAALLIDDLGTAAAAEAGARAIASRKRDNLWQFGHWRRVEAFISQLETAATPARLH